MPSVFLLNVTTWFCPTPFSGAPTFCGVTGNTRVDYKLYPRAVLPHITSSKVWRRAGDILQIIQTNQSTTRSPTCGTHTTSTACEGAPCAQRHVWDQDKIFAAAAQGANRNTFINEVENELQRRIPDNTSPLDVDVENEWRHSSVRKAAEKQHFTRSTQKKEDETMNTRLPRHTVLNVVGTFAHCVDCILKRGRYARARATEADHRVRSFKRAQRRELEHARLTASQEDWERRDFATTWKLTKVLTVKRIGPKKNVASLLPRLHPSANKNSWRAATLVDTSQTRPFSSDRLHSRSAFGREVFRALV